jgi:hypothetical protein
MKFLTHEEARELAANMTGLNGLPVVPSPGREALHEVFELNPGHTYFALAQRIVTALGPFQWCLLWVVKTGIWLSNENLHLYYRLRQSYGAPDHVLDRPGLLALRHEEADLVSFLHLGMLFGWEMFLVTSNDYGRAFISHDGFFVLSSDTIKPDATGDSGSAPDPAH